MRAETAIRQLADRQLHLVTRRQLLDAGFSASKIGRQLTSGRLCSVQPDVYLTAGRALSDAHNLPPPCRQFRVRAWSRNVRFDLAYPNERLAIELDGRAPHWGREAWQSDRDRDNATELGDWRVLRFTWWDVHERPLYFVVTVATALRLRPRGWMRDRSTKVGAL